MLHNLNGKIQNSEENIFNLQNRAFLLGDFISETVKITYGKVLLWEEHYFNLMASMRIFRMKIPMEFTQEFLEEELLKTVSGNGFRNALAEIIVFRNPDSDKLLTKSSVSYLIQIKNAYETEHYKWINDDSEIEIFKDFTVNPSFFSQVNSHKPEEIIARAYLQENEYTDLVLLNPEKRIARTVLGVPFLIQGNRIKTPKISEGGIRSVTRNYLIGLIQKSNEFTFEEAEIFPFELQKTDELFVLMGSEGILSIHQNRKKIYKTEQTAKVFKILNSDLTLRQAPLDLQI